MKKAFVLTILLLTLVALSGCSNQEVAIEQPRQAQKEQPQPEKKIYDIDLNAEHLGSRKFKVEGTTNLPNDSKIGIKIYDIDYFEHDDADSDWRLENLTYIGESAIVQSGTFSTIITASEIEAPLKSEQYTVKASFNPRSQSNNIKRIVGENGEHLDGTLLDNSIKGLVMLKTTSSINLK